MKRFLATTALLMLPIAATADGMDEDRIKELVLEAIRENPGIVFEAAQLFEKQQQALQAQAAAQVLDTEKPRLKMIPMRPFWAIRMAMSRLSNSSTTTAPIAAGLNLKWRHCLPLIPTSGSFTGNGPFWGTGRFLPPARRWRPETRANMKSFIGP